MSTPKRREYSIAVWIILIVIASLVLWFGWLAIRAVIAIIKFIGSYLQQVHTAASGSREARVRVPLGHHPILT